MDTRRRIARTALIAAGASALLLAGCAAPEPAAEASTTASPEPAPMPTPTQVPLEELELTADGIGDVALGAPVPEQDPATAVVAFDAEACLVEGAAPVEGGSEGAWFAAYEDVPDPWGGSGPAYHLVTADGTQDGGVTAVVVDGGTVTPEGITIGATRDEVAAAYPDAEVIEGQLSDTYVTEGEFGALVIEVATPVDFDYWEPALLDTVIAMRALGPELTREPVAGTDAFSPCPI
jgi:hypothetical protein